MDKESLQDAISPRLLKSISKCYIIQLKLTASGKVDAEAIRAEIEQYIWQARTLFYEGSYLLSMQ